MQWNNNLIGLAILLGSVAPVHAAQRGRTPPGAVGSQDLRDPAADATGPNGSSRRLPGEQRYDEIGYAGIRSVAGGGAADQAVVAVSRDLPRDTVVEVTALDNGRTALVLVTGTFGARDDQPLDLSAGAARALGHEGAERFAIRVRPVIAAPADLAALHAGRPAGARGDAPPVLLTALRKRLPVSAPATVSPPIAATAVAKPSRTPPSRMERATPASPPPRTDRAPAPSPGPRATQGRYLVQVAALSNGANAVTLAKTMGGFVKQGGGLHRVQLGPFATSAEAQAARAKAVRAGYADAHILAVH